MCGFAREIRENAYLDRGGCKWSVGGYRGDTTKRHRYMLFFCLTVLIIFEGRSGKRNEEKHIRDSAAFDMHASCVFRDCSELLDAEHGLRWRWPHGVFEIMRFDQLACAK